MISFSPEVKVGLTKSARSPVSGCTRTTGWIASSGFDAIFSP